VVVGVKVRGTDAERDQPPDLGIPFHVHFHTSTGSSGSQPLVSRIEVNHKIKGWSPGFP
jgi:hypothetical protein